MRMTEKIIKLIFLPIRILNNLIYGNPALTIVGYAWYTKEEYQKFRIVDAQPVARPVYSNSLKKGNMSNVQRIILMAIVVAFALSFTSPAFSLFGKKKTEAEKKKEIQQERADIQKMAKETLARLYKLQPSAKKLISNFEAVISKH